MKYIVQFGNGEGLWWPITKGATRENAHRLVARLGPRYRVYNLWTHAQSHPEKGH